MLWTNYIWLEYNLIYSDFCHKIFVRICPVSPSPPLCWAVPPAESVTREETSRVTVLTVNPPTPLSPDLSHLLPQLPLPWACFF